MELRRRHIVGGGAQADVPEIDTAARDVMRVMVAFDTLGAVARERGDLSHIEVVALLRIYLAGSISFNALAREMSISKSAVSAMISRLSNKNWVEIQDDPEDMRRRLISTTEFCNEWAWDYFRKISQAAPGLVDPRTGGLVPPVEIVLRQLTLLLESRAQVFRTEPRTERN